MVTLYHWNSTTKSWRFSLQLNCDNSLEYKLCNGNIVQQELVKILCKTPLQKDEKDDDKGVELSDRVDVFYDEDSDDGEE